MKHALFAASCAAVFLCAASAHAQTTYDFVSPPLTTSISEATACVIGDCGVVRTPTDRITGVVTVSESLPDNGYISDIRPYLLAWSFSDGHQTVASDDPLAVIHDFSGQVVDGALTEISFQVQRRWNVTIGTGDSDSNARLNALRYYGGPGALSVVNGYCTNWSAEVCTSLSFDAQTSAVSGGGAADLTARIESEPAPIPTLSEWAMIGLISLLAAIGAAGVWRRRSLA